MKEVIKGLHLFTTKIGLVCWVVKWQAPFCHCSLAILPLFPCGGFQGSQDAQSRRRHPEREAGPPPGARTSPPSPSPARSSRESSGRRAGCAAGPCGHGAGPGGADAAAAARGRLWPGRGLRPHRASQDAPGVSEARPVSGGAEGPGPGSSLPPEGGAAAGAAQTGLRVGSARAAVRCCPWPVQSVFYTPAGGAGTGIFPLVTGDRTRANMKPCQGRFRLGIRERFFSQRVAEHWKSPQGNGHRTRLDRVPGTFGQRPGAQVWFLGCPVHGAGLNDLGWSLHDFMSISKASDIYWPVTEKKKNQPTWFCFVGLKQLDVLTWSWHK